MKSALVTGASRGIGRAVAFEFARQGWGLTVSSRSESDLAGLADELLAGGAAEVVRHAADLADRDSLGGVVDTHRAAYGAMDSLVLSGGVGTAGNVATMQSRRVDKTLAVNFTSTLELIKHALPLLREAGASSPRGARVILLASITGVYAEPGLSVYGATKAALLLLAETLTLEEAANGVLATAIAPGYVDTDMAAWTADTIAADTMITVADVVAVVRMVLELGRNASVPKIVMSRSDSGGYRA